MVEVLPISFHRGVQPSTPLVNCRVDDMLMHIRECTSAIIDNDTKQCIGLMEYWANGGLQVRISSPLIVFCRSLGTITTTCSLCAFLCFFVFGFLLSAIYFWIIIS